VLNSLGYPDGSIPTLPIVNALVIIATAIIGRAVVGAIISRTMIDAVVWRTMRSAGNGPTESVATALSINVSMSRKTIETAATWMIAEVVGAGIQIPAGLRISDHGIAACFGRAGNCDQRGGGEYEKGLEEHKTFL
jgi:hypothetical protein